MAVYDSDVSRFNIDDTAGTARSFDASIDNIEGLPGSSPVENVQGLGSSGFVGLRQTPNIQFSMSGHYNDAANDVAAVLGGLRRHMSAVDFDYGPAGEASGDIKYSGTCWVTEFTVTSAVGSRVTWRASFQVEGDVTVGTY